MGIALTKEMLDYALQLNDALGGSPKNHHQVGSGAEARPTVDYNEARGPGDETWQQT